VTLHTLPAILLRAHPYSETSRILRFLTPELGVVATLARGVRARSGKGTGALETFARGDLTVDLRPDRDLQGYRDFRPGPGDPRRLGRGLFPFAAASYLAELVLAHQLEEESELLFRTFSAGLDALESAPDPDLPGHFLSAGWQILAVFGFPPELEACVRCGGPVEDAEAEPFPRFDLEAGGLRCPECALGGEGPRIGPGARRVLHSLVGGGVVVPGGGAARGGGSDRSASHLMTGSPVEGLSAHLTLLDRFALLHLGMGRPFRSEPLLRAAVEALPQVPPA
jgi:DNA repair protein RecO